jgi:hypothetical protein
MGSPTLTLEEKEEQLGQPLGYTPKVEEGGRGGLFD